MRFSLQWKRLLRAYVTLGALTWMAGCGSATSVGNSSTTTASATVPTDVVVSSPTASTAATSSSLAVKEVIAVDADASSTAATDYGTKRQALATLAAGTGSCAFSLPRAAGTRPSCYGPTVNVLNHPEAIHPDADSTGDQDGDRQLPQGDLGIWSASEGTQACAAAEMNNLVDGVAAKVDTVMNMFAAMACAESKGGVVLPAVGETLDVTSVVTAQTAITGITVSSASLARSANDSDGNPVYVSTISMTVTNAQGTQTVNLILKHIPTAADNSTYKGKVSFRLGNATGTESNCPQGTSGTTSAGTVLYSKTSSSSVIYLLNSAEFCGSTTNPFDSNNNISASDKASMTNTDGWGGNWNYGVFGVNPQNGTGSVAYAWQAGQGDSATRVFNMSTSVAADNSASGTAYFGFGPAVSDATFNGSITGFYCNWAAAGVSHTASLRAQRQELSRAIAATNFTASSSNIRFAPTNSCDAGPADPQGNPFTYTSGAGAVVGTMDNDVNTPTTVTNTLIPLTSVVFTLPTAPGDV